MKVCNLIECKPLIYPTQIIWSNRIQNSKYLGSNPSGCKDIGIIKLDSLTKTPSSPIKIWGNSVQRFMSHDRTSNKQKYKQRLLYHSCQEK